MRWLLGSSMMLLAMSAVPDQALATNPEAENPTVVASKPTPYRQARPYSLHAIGGIWSEPMAGQAGIQFGYSFHPNFSVTITAELLVSTMLSAGGRWIWFDQTVSPYLYGEVGLVVNSLKLGDSYDSILFLAETGLGCEFATSSGFSMFVEGGVGLGVADGASFNLTAGMGYRF